MQGAPSFVKTDSRKPAAIAIREVDEGLVPFYMPEEETPPEEEAADESEETESSE
jgi:DNA-directed RNA polymerase subunit K/omega